MAGDSLNQANPPVEFEDIWGQVYNVIRQYNLAYNMLIQGTPISSKNLGYLEDSRRLLAMDQEMVERALAQRGLGKDFFSEQQKAVEQHLQQAYGNEPVPTLLP